MWARDCAAPRVFPVRAAALCIWLALLGGCGSVIGTDRPGLPATLALEGAPGAQHAGIYMAISRGYDLAEGVELEIAPPEDAADSVDVRLATGDFDQVLLSARGLARARKRGVDLVAVAALEQRATDSQGPLLLCADRGSIDEDRAVIRATIRALGRGYGEAQRDPESAVAAIRAEVPELDEKRTVVRLHEISDSFSAGVTNFGELRPQRLKRWLDRDALVPISLGIDKAVD